MPYLGVGRLALAIITFSFVVYLIPGMWGAPCLLYTSEAWDELVGQIRIIRHGKQ